MGKKDSMRTQGCASVTSMYAMMARWSYGVDVACMHSVLVHACMHAEGGSGMGALALGAQHAGLSAKRVAPSNACGTTKAWCAQLRARPHTYCMELRAACTGGCQNHVHTAASQGPACHHPCSTALGSACMRFAGSMQGLPNRMRTAPGRCALCAAAGTCGAF